MQADAIQTDFSDAEPHTPDKQLIALYKKHLIGIYNNHIKDIDKDKIPYDKVFNLIDKLREFFAWIYYFSKEQKLNPINTTNLTELYIIMEQFAIRDHPVFHLDGHFFHTLLHTNNPCGNDHNYPTHLVFLKHLCSKRVRGQERPGAMVAAYPQAVWMDYPLFFPDGNAHLTDAEILSYSLAAAAPAAPAAQAPAQAPGLGSLLPLQMLTKKGASRSVSKHKKVSKSNRITHKKRR